MFNVGDRVVRTKENVSTWWKRRCRESGILPDCVLVVTAITDESVHFKGLTGAFVIDAFELAIDWKNASEIDLIKSIGYAKHYKE